MTLYFDNERLENAVLAVLKSELSAALDTIEARWTADPLTLPDVVTYGDPGLNPNAIEQSYDYYPYVDVFAGERNPSDQPGARSDQYAMQLQTVDAIVSFVVVEDDVATINKLAKRYAEAIDLVLQNNPVFEAATRRRFKQDGRLSRVAISGPGRYSQYDTVGRQGADTFSPDHESWMVAGTLEITLNG